MLPAPARARRGCCKAGQRFGRHHAMSGADPEEVGGLVVRKDPDKHVFKAPAPKSSLLGAA